MTCEWRSEGHVGKAEEENVPCTGTARPEWEGVQGSKKGSIAGDGDGGTERWHRPCGGFWPLSQELWEVTEDFEQRVTWSGLHSDQEVHTWL